MIVQKLRRAVAVLAMISASVSVGAVIALTGRGITLSTLHADRLQTVEQATNGFSQGQKIPQNGAFTAILDYEVFNAEGDLIAARPAESEIIKPAQLDPALLDYHQRVMQSGRILTTSAPSLPSSLISLSPPGTMILLSPLGSDQTGSIRFVVEPNAAGKGLVGAVNAAGLIAAILAALALFSAFFMYREGRNVPARVPRSDLSTARNRDALTGLPNRETFLARLDELVAADTKRERQFAVITIDLDRFESVNNAWEHVVGDAILQEATRRIRQLVGGKATMGRVSGDEFAVAMEEDANPRSLKHLAQAILDKLAEPFDVDDVEIALSASAGIAAYPVNAQSGTALFRAADLALRKAKGEGGRTYRFFDTAMEEQMQRHGLLERDLRRALAEDEFVVFYQPQMNLNTGDICGYEALIRWERPGEGIVPPLEFIPVAEATGLIRPLGEWVLRRACQDAVNWLKTGTIAVNFSPIQFRYPGTEDMIERILEETGLDPCRLEIELTESLFLNRETEVLETLRRIKDLGVRIAMDDFGTGYSTLSYLTQFPFDKIKIDRSFVYQLSGDPQIGAIISSIVGLGRSLTVDITAEGVETEDQVTLLKAAGCGIVQGFLFGAPQRAEQSLPPVFSPEASPSLGT